MNPIIKYSRKIIFTIFMMFLISFVLIEGMILYGRSNYEEKKVEYVITLGARLYGRSPSQALSERLHTTLEYAEKYKGSKIIVCGGQGVDEDIPEAEAMESFLLDKGISQDRIIKEQTSTSTFENLKNAKDIINEIDNGENLDIVIVTSDFHVFRSKFIAKRLGFNPIGLPAKTPTVSIPKSYIREYFAVLKSIILDKV
ncbi:hypothetical protein Curi_c24540 [Gottschalkia acidurici 9a]|uniref:DUF218 domain-containing protein n=1 Tax=Gottschalkia acidurici (strain ATCC 7906 / DSM 604 / BCRC 14475 / CIP 104303 / KCTC 5404 / NCIMB 10678 / 9a) TaxID=1128398 RepID=K0B1W1_GOTA9|nr:YdcF family protein [Gottschalkia acidurici]AFS79449.1 hypothetical protein Curi_c24540 [Gottschalkia acidurici 9a]